MLTRQPSLEDLQQRVGTLEALGPTWKMPTWSSSLCLWPMATTTLPYQWRRGATNRTSATCCRPQATEATQRQETTEMAQQLQNHRLRDGGCKGNTSDAAQ